MDRKAPRTDDLQSAKDRLQPALLDRLTDDAPEKRNEALSSVFVTDRRLRESLIRDLDWLLNTSAPAADDFGAAEMARDSVINYGIPALAGKRSSDIEVDQVESAIREAIERFEPRILRDSLEIKRTAAPEISAHQNTLYFQIRCRYWSEPYPLELLLRSAVDLENGQIRLDSSADSARTPRRSQPQTSARPA